jgi:hypothetical protein
LHAISQKLFSPAKKIESSDFDEIENFTSIATVQNKSGLKWRALANLSLSYAHFFGIARTAPVEMPPSTKIVCPVT